MNEHNIWLPWDLYVTCLLMARDAVNIEENGLPAFADAALQCDADLLFEFFNLGDIDARIQVYGMIDSGTVEDRIGAAAELYEIIKKKVSA